MARLVGLTLENMDKETQEIVKNKKANKKADKKADKKEDK